MNKILISFGRTIRNRRQEINLSQEKLAQRANLHRTYISSIERGERNVALKNFIKLSIALEMPPDELMKQIMDLTDELNNKTTIESSI